MTRRRLHADAAEGDKERRHKYTVSDRKAVRGEDNHCGYSNVGGGLGKSSHVGQDTILEGVAVVALIHLDGSDGASACGD